MDYLSYIVTPLVCAVIGYSTNWLAIKMLFRPHREIRLWGLRLPFTPGLIPKEREKLAAKIAETVSRHVLTPEILAQELSALAKNADKELNAVLPRLLDWMRDGLRDNPAMEAWLVDMIKKLVQEHVGRLAGLFIDPERIYKSVKDGLFAYLSDADNQAFLLKKAEDNMSSFGFEKALENVMTHIARQIPVKDMIENKINAFQVDEAEKIILSVVNRELNMITILGGALGLLIGLITVLFQ